MYQFFFFLRLFLAVRLFLPVFTQLAPLQNVSQKNLTFPPRLLNNLRLSRMFPKEPYFSSPSLHNLRLSRMFPKEHYFSSPSLHNLRLSRMFPKEPYFSFPSLHNLSLSRMFPKEPYFSSPSLHNLCLCRMFPKGTLGVGSSKWSQLPSLYRLFHELRHHASILMCIISSNYNTLFLFHYEES